MRLSITITLGALPTNCLTSDEVKSKYSLTAISECKILPNKCLD